MLKLTQFKVPLETEVNQLKALFLRLYRIPAEHLLSFRVVKESLDARKDRLQWVYALEFSLKQEELYLTKNKGFERAIVAEIPEIIKSENPPTQPPIIVGMGPAGLFCAYGLTLKGCPPILLDRGEAIEERTLSVDAFWETGKLNTASNVQFGEGGAGTFSDGKLTTRIKDPRGKAVLEILCRFGAPEEILYKQKPHIGTDLLKGVMIRMREWLKEQGAEFRYSTHVVDLVVENLGSGLQHDDEMRVKGVSLSTGEILLSDTVVLAIGHSARDTYEMLYKKGVTLVPKPFAMGFRIEHPQTMINQAQYGAFKAHPRLGAAEYQLSVQTAAQRGVYTFCMCPGGYVVNASSEEGKLAVNGMSYHARAGENANSAVLVTVTPEDFPGDHPLRAMAAQQQIEEKAYHLGGGGFCAPIQKVSDFLQKRPSSSLGTVSPTITPSYVLTDLSELYDADLTAAIREGLILMGRKLKGFDFEDAILTGVETRTSAPVRIARDPETMEATHFIGLFPIGEGAGYAGGIMSSAVDGLKVAEGLF